MPHPLRLVVGRFDLRPRRARRSPTVSGTPSPRSTGRSRWTTGCCAPLIVTIKDAAGELAGEVRLRAGRPMGVSGTLSGRWRLPDGHDYRFSSAVRGNLDRLGTDLRLVQPARLSFSGNALALTAAPRLVGTLRAIEFDGSPWVPAGRFPRVSGSIAINAGRNSIGVDGTLTSTGLIDEPLRLQGGGTWQGRVIEITALRAWLPRSAASFTTSGTIDLAPESPVLALARRVVDTALAARGRAGRHKRRRHLPHRRESSVRLRGEGRDRGCADTSGRLACDGTGRPRCPHDRCRRRVHAGRPHPRRRPSGVDRRPALAIHRASPLARSSRAPRGSRRTHRFRRIDRRTRFWHERTADRAGRIAARACFGGARSRAAARSSAATATTSCGRCAWQTAIPMRGSTVATDRRLDLVLDADLRSLAIVDPQLSGRVTAHGPRTGDALATIDHRRGDDRDAQVPGRPRWRR